MVHKLVKNAFLQESFLTTWDAQPSEMNAFSARFDLFRPTKPTSCLLKRPARAFLACTVATCPEATLGSHLD